MFSSGWLLQVFQDKDSGGARAIVKSKALLICRGSREPSPGSGVRVLPRGNSAAPSFCHLLPKACTRVIVCTNTCVRSSNISTHMHPHPLQTLKLTCVCTYFKCIHISTSGYLLKHMDASALNTSTQIHTHATHTITCAYF